VALTSGCRLAYVAGLILGVMGILGAHGGSLTQAPADSLLNIPVAGSRRKPPVKFSHRVHEARRVACARCHHDYQISATSGVKGNRWKSARPATVRGRRPAVWMGKTPIIANVKGAICGCDNRAGRQAP
jgi:hypothetical protein